MTWQRDFVHDGEARRVSCRRLDGDRYEVQVGPTRHEVSASRLQDGRVRLSIDGRAFLAAATRASDGGVQVRVAGHTWHLPAHKGGRAGSVDAATGDVVAPMTGTLLDLSVALGQQVAVGDCVAVVTAMKMEHKLLAQIAGEVVEIGVKVGQNVDEGALVVRIA